MARNRSREGKKAQLFFSSRAREDAPRRAVFLHWFHKHVSSTYCMSGAILACGDTAKSKMDNPGARGTHTCG